MRSRASQDVGESSKRFAAQRDPKCETREMQAKMLKPRESRGGSELMLVLVLSLSALNTVILGSKLNAPSISNLKHQELQKNLNERQYELIKQNPGSLVAVARALKMAMIECQHQMRHEPWDCPIYGFSTKPVDVFGKLMSRSFKETSFIHSLLSAALTHSVARACTESLIATCGRRQTRDGGYSEDVEFGQQFAQEFMEATHELYPTLEGYELANAIERNSPSSNEISPAPLRLDRLASQSQAAKYEQSSPNALDSGASSAPLSPRKDMTIRGIINAHNDELGRLLVLNNMRRACKCHGLSGACNMQTCWLKLPSFREVANQLHDKFDQAIRLISVTHRPISRPKMLTSAPSASLTSKKSNKKRSSFHHQLNGLSRSSTSSSQQTAATSIRAGPFGASQSSSYTNETPKIIGSRSNRAVNRHSNSDNSEDLFRSSSDSARSNIASISPNSLGSDLVQMRNSTDLTTTRDPMTLPDTPISPPRLSRISAVNATIIKRPVARSIGLAAQYMTPSKLDLLYNQNSPDFCQPSERYDIKGTKGRQCSENPNASNKCETLCCGRGYKIEVREEKYNCECQFKFCCQLNCKTCTRPKAIYKCL